MHVRNICIIVTPIMKKVWQGRQKFYVSQWALSSWYRPHLLFGLCLQPAIISTLCLKESTTDLEWSQNVCDEPKWFGNNTVSEVLFHFNMIMSMLRHLSPKYMIGITYFISRYKSMIMSILVHALQKQLGHVVILDHVANAYFPAF